jgi:hypothetical protein
MIEIANYHFFIDYILQHTSAISKLDKIKLSINSLDFYNTTSVDLDAILKDINLLESYGIFYKSIKELVNYKLLKLNFMKLGDTVLVNNVVWGDKKNN